MFLNCHNLLTNANFKPVYNFSGQDTNSVVTHCGSGASAAQLFYIILCDFPPYISKSVGITGAVELHRGWGCSYNAWCSVYKVHDVQVSIE